MAPFYTPLLTEMIMQTARELMLVEFEQMRRHHQLPEEMAANSNGGIRSWIASWLAAIALRLDRPAARGALGT